MAILLNMLDFAIDYQEMLCHLKAYDMKWLLFESSWTINILQQAKCVCCKIAHSCEGTRIDVPVLLSILVFLCSLFQCTNIDEKGLLKCDVKRTKSLVCWCISKGKHVSCSSQCRLKFTSIHKVSEYFGGIQLCNLIDASLSFSVLRTDGF